MRTWIDSVYFPEEMRIKMINDVPSEMMIDFSNEQKQVLENLAKMLSDSPWDVDSIGSCIVEAAKSIQLSPRVAYGVSYICLMGNLKGPRLAPILVELNQSDIVNQLNRCLEFVN